MVPLKVPALRERREDVPALAQHFIGAVGRELPACRRASCRADTLAALQAYDWPGNVRQLRNLMDWLLIMAPGECARPDPCRHAAAGDRRQCAGAAEASTDRATSWRLPLREARDLFETQYLQAQLLRFGGNISRTAQFVGMERSALHRKLKFLGVHAEDRAPAASTGVIGFLRHRIDRGTHVAHRLCQRPLSRPAPRRSVNIEDRGYQFGDGIYEVVHLYDGRFVDEDLHLDRLERSPARDPAAHADVAAPRCAIVLAEVGRRNRVTEGLLYMQVTRGVARRDHAFPAKPVPPALVVTVKRIAAYPTDVDKWAAACDHPAGPALGAARHQVGQPAAELLARQAAREQGAIEAILYDEATGMVTEGAATTFWIVDEQGVIRTRQLDHVSCPAAPAAR